MSQFQWMQHFLSCFHYSRKSMSAIHLGLFKRVQSPSWQTNPNPSKYQPLLSTSAPSQPLVVGEEEEGEDEEPTAKFSKTVDEPEDKKEEYDEDDDEEKATVDVMKPVPEPEEEAPKTEPSGQSLSLN